MTLFALRRCHGELSALGIGIETAARALGDGLGRVPSADMSATLVHLQASDMTVQRCAHGRDALAVLVDLDDPVLVALGCRLLVQQLDLACTDFEAAVTALLTEIPTEVADAVQHLGTAADRLRAVRATLEQHAAPAPLLSDDQASLRMKLLAHLKPAYTMPSERAVLARFLGVESAPLVADTPDDCFL